MLFLICAICKSGNENMCLLFFFSDLVLKFSNFRLWLGQCIVLKFEQKFRIRSKSERTRINKQSYFFSNK